MVIYMYHIIVNPASRSGRGKKYWKMLQPILDERNISYQVYITTHQGHTTEITKELSSVVKGTDEFIHIIILGGDGTINEALQGITCFENVILSYIPTGSSNDFARDLGISKDPVTALNRILSCPPEKKIDLGLIHFENSLVRDGQMDIPDRYFAVSCGIGYDAAICKEAMASPVKNFLNRCGLGKLTYVAIALKQLVSTEYITGELTLDDNDSIIPLQKLLFIAGMNHKYEGGGFQFAPDACDTDGKLNLCVITRIAKPKIPFILPSGYKGTHYRFDGIDAYQASSYTVRTSSPLWVHTDGEVRTKADFIFVKCEPAKLRFIY